MITLIKRGVSYNSLISEIYGLSSETKPVTEIEGRFIENGSVYTEIDTGKKFMYDKENKKWYEITSSGGGGDSSEYAHSLVMTIDSQTYVLTATLKNTSGETLGTPQTIDLPLETMVVGGSYDDTTKKVILTLKNGNTVDFSVADLVSGLQTEITSTNKLNSDLVDDTNQNNKFVTSAEKTKIANALTEEVYNAGKQITTDGKTGEIFNSYSNNKATGNNSHAEGYGTTASGHASHAEGTNTVASAFYAHAEGWGTTASGNSSHTEGSITRASASYSHAEGYYTIARSMYQHVQGKYNVEDANDKYAFIIGNGTANENRSNAFAVDWKGKIYINNSNKGTDVSAHDNALVKLVDGGAKNFLKNEGTTTSTATVNSDGTIIINGTNTSAVNITLSSTTKLPAGDYVLSTENTGSNVYLTVRVANDTQYTCTGNTKSIPFTLNEETTLERVYLFINANTSVDNLKLTPMICSKAAWDISQNYVPYRPSYDELVARITALENA